MTALEIIRQLARMSHPYDEFKAGGDYATADDYADDLSSDRMEDDARALWRLIEEARGCLRDTASAEAAAEALGIVHLTGVIVGSYEVNGVPFSRCKFITGALERPEIVVETQALVRR